MPLVPPPVELERLVGNYREAEQRPVQFRPSTWVEELRGDASRFTWILTDDRFTRPTTGGRPGDRLIDREALERAARLAAQDDDHRLATFLLVQVWGSGTTATRIPRYTRAAFDDRERLLTSLATTAHHLQEATDTSVLAKAYPRTFCAGVRRSFFTKWFAFAGRRDDRTWQPLILDDRVLATLNTLSITTKNLAGSRYWADRYRAYVEQLHAWAPVLGAEPERLEWILFEHKGKPLPTEESATGN